MRPSSIDDQPEEIRNLIGRLRGQGYTIDRIKEHMRELDIPGPSRSALGRHVKKMEKIGERVRSTREMAKVVHGIIGDEPGKTVGFNIELLQGTLLRIFNQADDDTDAIDEGARAALAGNPTMMMQLAKTIEALARASKTNAEFIAKVEARAAEKERKAIAERIEAATKDTGISKGTVNKIKAEVFGVRAPA